MEFIEFIDNKNRRISVKLSEITLYMISEKGSDLIFYLKDDPGSQFEIPFDFPLLAQESYDRVAHALNPLPELTRTLEDEPRRSDIED